ncbi:hypothetical protein Pelo_9636 [Pelomyxa schiedti]|nr:hypothetical protein Pelo_9636 [Pelomyxa schiedti]
MHDGVHISPRALLQQPTPDSRRFVERQTGTGRPGGKSRRTLRRMCVQLGSIPPVLSCIQPTCSESADIGALLTSSSSATIGAGLAMTDGMMCCSAPLFVRFFFSCSRTQLVLKWVFCISGGWQLTGFGAETYHQWI